MLDLAAQHFPLRDALRAAFERVLAKQRYILGDEVAAFEREVAAACGLPHAVAVSSGSDALVAMLMASGIGPGDEVVTTPYSFFASTEAIVRVGARPVFADVEPTTLNLDPNLAAERIGARTKAVLVVHLFGRTARTESLGEACARSGVLLFEDAAQAIGARDLGRSPPRPAGGLGRGGALSFFPSKNLGGFGDGGMVVTDDGDFAARVRRIRSHGASERHRHDVVGGNFRLDELQAALLRTKLPHLEGWVAERRRLATSYLRLLGGLPLALPPDDAGCVWNQFVIRVPAHRRPALVAHLEARGIASAIYYPTPLHLQPALAGLGYAAGDFPVAERAAVETLALPLYPGLGDAGLSRVAGAVRDFFAGA